MAAASFSTVTKASLKPRYRFFEKGSVLPLWVGGKSLKSSENLPIVDKYTNETIGSVAAIATKELIDEVFTNIEEYGRRRTVAPAYIRKSQLAQISNTINHKRDKLAELIQIEVGKTSAEANAEIDRAVDVFALASEECTRNYGEFRGLDDASRTSRMLSITHKVPAGLVSMITPFNFPLNLAAHKIAPAIAAGCPWVLKPSEKTPAVASAIGEILSGILQEPDWAILPCVADIASHFSTNPRIQIVSFTGSVGVGWHIKSNCGKAKALLELGGNGAVIIDSSVPSSSLEWIASRVAFGGYAGAGQSCVSVQRVYVDDSLYEPFLQHLKTAVSKLVVGDPFESTTTLGPVISPSSVQRLDQIVQSAVKDGATVVYGGRTVGETCFEPTILTNLRPHDQALDEEIFGPIVCVEKLGKATPQQIINASKFGLQAGLFTNNLDAAFKTFAKVRVGGLIINDVPTVRSDSQAYGGTKDSGVGREGVRYAIEDFTEYKVLNFQSLPGPAETKLEQNIDEDHLLYHSSSSKRQTL